MELLARAYNEKLREYFGAGASFSEQLLSIVNAELEILDSLIRRKCGNVKITLFVKTQMLEIQRALYCASTATAEVPPEGITCTLAELYRRHADLITTLDKAITTDTEKYTRLMSLALRALSFFAGIAIV